jgi:hypothetical protein
LSIYYQETSARFVPYWNESIAPAILAGNNVIVAAHGNTLRALVKHLDNIPEDVIAELNIPTGVPLVYELDDALRPIKQADAIAPLSGRYLGDQADVRARIEGVKVQRHELYFHLFDHVRFFKYIMHLLLGLESNEKIQMSERFLLFVSTVSYYSGIISVFSNSRFFAMVDIKFKSI